MDSAFEELQHRYLYDPTFHHLVDSMVHAIERGDVSFTGILEALILTIHTISAHEYAKRQHIPLPP